MKANEMKFPKKLDLMNLDDIGSEKVSQPCPPAGGFVHKGETEGLDSAMVWEFEDLVHPYWYPQGVAGMQDDHQLFLLISWYYKPSSAARVSFVKVGSTGEGNHDYVHVLLLDEKGNPLRTHAGGMFKVGNYLYVASTGTGLNYFDVTKIISSDDGMAFKYTDYDCNYALKACGRTIDLKSKLNGQGLENISFSWCDLPRNERDRVLTGSYVSVGEKYKDRSRFVAEFSRSGTDDFKLEHCWKDPDKASWPNNMQGTTLSSKSGQDVLFASCSGDTAHLKALVCNEDGKWEEIKSWLWPYGTEDVHISDTGNIWGCTEHRGLRFIFRAKISNYESMLDL